MEELELIQKDREEETVESTLVSQKTNGKRNPPARNTSRFWFERFLSVIQRQNPTIIDSAFLSQVAPNNEGKLLAQLKFLHVIDEQCRPMPLLSSLNMIGTEQKKGFQQMIHEAYGELIASVVLEKALPDDVVNYFIRRYAFTRDKAINATKFFLYLVEKASLSVSSELSSFIAEKPANNAQAQPASYFSQPSPRIASRVPREPRSLLNGQKKRADSAGGFQTMIHIHLDKDTPREYWDRVLALAGEKKADEIQIEETS